MRRRIDFREVDWGEMGAKRDWKIVVVSDSRCFGIGFVESSAGVVVEGSGVGVLKLFMTSWKSLLVKKLVGGGSGCAK